LIIGFQSNQLELGREVHESAIFFLNQKNKPFFTFCLKKKKSRISAEGGKQTELGILPLDLNSVVRSICELKIKIKKIMFLRKKKKKGKNGRTHS